MEGLDYVLTSLQPCILELYGLPTRHKHLQYFLKFSVNFIFGLEILRICDLLFTKYNVKLLFSRGNKEVIIGSFKNHIFNSAFCNTKAAAWFYAIVGFFNCECFAAKSLEQRRKHLYENCNSLFLLQGSRYLFLNATSGSYFFHYLSSL